MSKTTKRNEMLERIRKHGLQLMAIFPKATERDPVALCKKLRRLETEAHAIGLRMCNGPEYPEGEDDAACERVLAKANALLGNVRDNAPKTGQRCTCKRGQERDNCAACEGSGYCIDFRAIRAMPRIVAVFVNRDPRGYALKINDEWMRSHGATLYSDWGGYGIIAPDLSEND